LRVRVAVRESTTGVFGECWAGGREDNRGGVGVIVIVYVLVGVGLVLVVVAVVGMDVVIVVVVIESVVSRVVVVVIGVVVIIEVAVFVKIVVVGAIKSLPNICIDTEINLKIRA